jgi:hypothetical protein
MQVLDIYGATRVRPSLGLPVVDSCFLQVEAWQIRVHETKPSCTSQLSTRFAMIGS